MRRVIELGTVGLALALAFVPLRPSAVERWYSGALYPRLQQIVTPVSNRIPIALLDVLVFAGAVALLWGLASAIRASRRERRVAPLGRAAVRLAFGAAAVYLAFLALWGLNYRRVPMTERVALGRGAPSPGDVMALGVESIARLNALHPAAHAEGWNRAELDDTRLRAAFDTVQGTLSDAPRAVPGRLKGTLFGRYFRWSGVDGMVNPFGLEVLANPDLLPFERPFVAAHEWSHLAGYADESEANFVGWLTCIRASVPAQYSGWLYLYWQVSGEVGVEDRARLWAAVEAGPRRDIEAIVARLQRGQLPLLRSASWFVYDQYLKANRVDEGIRSYGAVVTLILRARFEPEWTPVRRVP